MNFVLRQSPLLSPVTRRLGPHRLRCLSCTTRQFSENPADSWASGSPQEQPSAGQSRILDVSDLADQMRQEVRRYTWKINNAKGINYPIRLAGVIAADAMPQSQQLGASMYAAQIAQTLQEDGIDYEHVECQGEQPHHIDAQLQELNSRSDVHGILVYYPIFQEKLHATTGPHYPNVSTGVYYKSYDDYLRDRVSAKKDVEGLGHGHNSRWHFRARAGKGKNRTKWRESYVPCTALAVARILEAYHAFPTPSLTNQPQTSPIYTYNPWRNVTATVINRSEILGRPLAALLAMKGATVYSVDEHSILMFQNNGRTKRLCRSDDPQFTLEWCLQQSTIAVTGVPHPDFRLPLEALLEKANDNSNYNEEAAAVTVVNVSEFDNLTEEEVLERPENISFIPNVGKVTVAALEQNLVCLHKSQARGSNRNRNCS